MDLTERNRSRVIDLSGSRFGMLVAAEYLGNRYWRCVCDCGRSRNADGRELRRGKCSSCGCTKDVRPPDFDLTGRTFGRLTVIEYVGGQKWNCRCDCGNHRLAKGWYLRNGTTTSCGCFRQVKGALVPRHPMTGTPEWIAWMNMKSRCLNPTHQAYENYGGRGITVCSEWIDSFDVFYQAIGPRPSSGHSLDRFPDNHGNYEPGNCRWATRLEQEHNKRSNRLLEFRGQVFTLSELAHRHGLSHGQLSDRLDYGWSLERALTTNVRSYERASDT